MIRSLIRWFTRPRAKSKNWDVEPFVDPIFGDCRYSHSTKGWWTRWQIPENRQLTIMGRSKRPTPEQIALWHQVQERMPQLVREANASIPEPTVTNFTPAIIKREGIELSEVRFESDGTVELFLDFMITDPQGYDLFPQVIFRDWKIVSSEWCV